MANKYISHGNTYDGDGTTKDAAASNGGVGSWNNLISIMTAAPTYGSLAAGDVVNIRSYISADINIAIGATYTMISVGTQDAPIWWVMDDGTIWATGGTLTMTWSANYSWTIQNHNHLIGKNYNWVFHHTLIGRKLWIYTKQQFLKEIKVSCVNGTGYCQITQSGYRSIWYNDQFAIYSQEGVRRTFVQQDYARIEFLGCEFDLSGVTSASLVMHEISCYHGGRTDFIGCSITGGMDTHYVWNNPQKSQFEQIYFTHTNFTPMYEQNYNTSAASFGYNGICKMTDIPGSKFGALCSSPQGRSHWIDGENYPVLNAQLPDVTSWSIKCFLTDSDSYMPLIISTSSKQNNATAAVRKITANVLIDDDFDTPKDNKWWMEVCWVDTSGDSHVQTTRILYNEQTLTSSSAGWNAEVYGKKNYTKYKFEITTTAAVKQYTDVIVYLYTEYAPGGTDNFIFADPDFALETI